MSVAGKVELRIIYRSLNDFSRLEELRFLIHKTHSDIMNLSPCLEWPKKLKRLYLAGMIDYSNSLYKGGFSSTLTHLANERCAGIRKRYILCWLKLTERNLELAALQIEIRASTSTISLNTCFDCVSSRSLTNELAKASSSSKARRLTCKGKGS